MSKQQPSMPQQQEESEVGGTEGAVPGKVESGEGASYWEAPKEVSLMGRTLSTLDMTMLETEHPDEDKEKKDTYWEATPEKALEGRTLSTLDMLNMTMPDANNTPDKKQTTNTAAAAGEPVAPPSPTSSKKSTSSSKRSITAEEPEGDALEPSYWDVPKELSLMGKTLSTLDMTMLETERPDKDKEKKDNYWEATPETTLQGRTLSTLDMTMMEANNPEEQQKKKDSYWEAAPIDKTLKGKSLSTLELSALESSHPDDKKVKTDSYWDAPEENKLHGKTLSTIDLTTLESTGEKPSIEVAAPGAPSYWDDAPIDKSLQGKRLSQLDMAAMEKQHVDEPSSSSGEPTPYWDWKMKNFKKTLSRLSLSNLRSGSRKDDPIVDDDFCVHGGTNSGMNSRTNSSKTLDRSSGSVNSNTHPPVKPITKKVHKLRDTWRKSFHHMSTNTLDHLDESGSSGTRRLGSRIFKSRNTLDVSGGSLSSQGSDGGITF